MDVLENLLPGTNFSRELNVPWGVSTPRIANFSVMMHLKDAFYAQ